MQGTQSIGSLSSGDLEDPDFSKEQDLELKCARAFKAVLHFEQTHCLQVEVRCRLSACICSQGTTQRSCSMKLLSLTEFAHRALSSDWACGTLSMAMAWSRCSMDAQRYGRQSQSDQAGDATQYTISCTVEQSIAVGCMHTLSVSCVRLHGRVLMTSLLQRMRPDYKDHYRATQWGTSSALPRGCPSWTTTRTTLCCSWTAPCPPACR